MNILLAEDDAILADALTEQLRHAGFETEHAPNGAVAEFLLLRQSWDLCILDLGLPMVDGLTVLQRVRQRKPELPVLVLTALDDLQSRVAGLNAGADDYLTKPFDFPELEARLRALLRRSQSSSVANASMAMGALVFERDSRRASIDGTPLELSPRMCGPPTPTTHLSILMRATRSACSLAAFTALAAGPRSAIRPLRIPADAMIPCPQ